jgi:hypothetical protein
MAVDVKKRFLKYIAPENLVKYRSQTFLAPGLYVDPHFKKPGYWENQLQPDLDRLGGASLLKRNLYHAMEVADKYVWMWHERIVWFPSHHPAFPTCITVFAPNLPDELDLIAAVEPLAKAKELVSGKKIPNIIYNSTFDKLPENGQQIPGAIAYGYVGTVDEPVTLPIIATIRQNCCDSADNITAVLVENAGVVTNISTRIKKD